MKNKAFILLLMMISSHSFADSFWNHNGSLMRLQANGNQRVITYENPSATMRNAGVRPGTILFTGQRQGNQYFGKARVFSKYCATPLSYDVSGNVYNESTIVLIGNRLSISVGCQANGKVRTDKLVFNFIN